MSNSYYSPLKVFHHRDRVNDLAAGGRPNLLHVHLVPTNRCNQNCDFCAYRSAGYSSSEDFSARDEIPTAKLFEIVDDCAALGVKAIELTGGGEPTMHLAFRELCDRIVQNGMQYGIVTNGVRLPREAVEQATWVRFSVDAGTRETYAKTRHVGPHHFDDVRDKIRDITTSPRRATVGVGFVVTAANWPEVLWATKHAKEDGADNIRISAEFQSEGAAYFRDFHEQVRDLCRQAVALTDDSFKVFNLYGERIEDLMQRSPDKPTCGLQHFVTYIGADQNVYRCCVLAYNRLGLLGSIKDQSFTDLWRSDSAAELLQRFDARTCPQCMFNGKNRTIAYATHPNPGHVNFL